MPTRLDKTKRSHRATTVSDFVTAMNSIAPTALAQEWDNVGLLAGDTNARLRSVLLAIDLTPSVAEEAIRLKTDLLFCYHPPIFRPVKNLIAPGNGIESLVYKCIRNGVALYSSHTSLDAADGGTNDVIAELCGVSDTSPLKYVDTPGENICKLVVFAPPDHVESIANAAFAAGAGRIGEYQRCSFRTPGTGTFFGGDGTSPTIGRRGHFERVEEIRLELLTPRAELTTVVEAVRSSHPYDEPAFDIYPMTPTPTRGIGRVGTLATPRTLKQLGHQLKSATGAVNVATVGRPATKIKRVIVVVGAAGSLPFRAGIGRGDAVITGEIRHHDALAIDRAGASAIALGHWTSERPVLKTLIRRLKSAIGGVTLKLSRTDQEPLLPLT